MMLLFTNAEIHEFIDLYKDEPILWDPKHPNRRSKIEVTDAWIRIQKALSQECSVSDLKRKKESLMTTFRLNAQRKKTDRDFKPSWFAYDQMESFLGDKYDCHNIKDEVDLDSPSLEAYFEEINNTSGINLEALAKCKTRTETKKRKRKSKDSDESVTEFIIEDESDTKESSADDECDIYGRLLAMKLKKLNEYERDLAMHDIDNIMFQAKMKKVRAPKERSKHKSRQANNSVFVAISQENHSDLDETIYKDHLESD